MAYTKTKVLLKVLILLSFFSIQAQEDFYVSYNISYKSDIEKSKKSFKEAVTNTINKRAIPLIRDENDTLSSEKRKEMAIEMILQSMPAAETMHNLLLSNKETMVSIEVKDSMHTLTRNSKNDSIYENSESLNKVLNGYRYYEDEANIVQVEEDTSDVKYIKGIKCYKVSVVFYEEKSEDIMSFMSLIKYDMYVSDQVKCLYNPILKFKSLLERFYPLELKSQLIAFKGLEITYTLDQIHTSSN